MPRGPAPRASASCPPPDARPACRARPRRPSSPRLPCSPSSPSHTWLAHPSQERPPTALDVTGASSRTVMTRVRCPATRPASYCARQPRDEARTPCGWNADRACPNDRPAFRNPAAAQGPTLVSHDQLGNPVQALCQAGSTRSHRRSGCRSAATAQSTQCCTVGHGDSKAVSNLVQSFCFRHNLLMREYHVVVANSFQEADL
ncbi:hypothetical protein OBBRIDRAFT_245258 [Obba rivulosa]|uniref:Uncharacterized protein n=1 Tax=Obba rivulosa TaxID=1052685 RepID=A0A8E2DGV8_9APHY|nr:hypothetical protein OBBRIDRAFT_245258 [Obba rivulosa]